MHRDATYTRVAIGHDTPNNVPEEAVTLAHQKNGARSGAV